jgi:hypothetical protein
VVAIRLFCSLLGGLLGLYVFSVATGYIPATPSFGHVDLGVAGWLATLLFLPIAYCVSFFVVESPPPFRAWGMTFAALAAFGTWIALKRMRWSKDS